MPKSDGQPALFKPQQDVHAICAPSLLSIRYWRWQAQKWCRCKIYFIVTQPKI